MGRAAKNLIYSKLKKAKSKVKSQISGTKKDFKGLLESKLNEYNLRKLKEEKAKWKTGKSNVPKLVKEAHAVEPYIETFKDWPAVYNAAKKVNEEAIKWKGSPEYGGYQEAKRTSRGHVPVAEHMTPELKQAWRDFRKESGKGTFYDEYYAKYKPKQAKRLVNYMKRYGYKPYTRTEFK